MNTNKQINIMILLLFLSVLVTAGYTLWDSDRSNEAEDEQLHATIRRGAYLFSQNCRVCHGDAGEGGSAADRLRAAPPLNSGALRGEEDVNGETVITEAAFARQYKFVFNTINCGRVGKLMPVWGQANGGPLNEEQIKQLTVFIMQGGDEGWEIARDFGQHGAHEFHIIGDSSNGLALAAPVTESDTTLTLNKVEIVTVQPDGEIVASPAVNPNERLSIVDDEGTAEEIFLVTAVDVATRTVTVERGIGSTDPGAFDAGVEVLKPPSPPDGQIVQQSCGQLAGQSALLPAGPPVTALTIAAKGNTWNREGLSAVADVPLTIAIDNQDDGVQHNWRLTEGGEVGGEDVATTDPQAGPATQTLEFGPLAVGEYFYQCDIHPGLMEGVLTAYAPGDGPEGAADATASPAP
jgi:mono/diheme cytochrome c family protein